MADYKLPITDQTETQNDALSAKNTHLDDEVQDAHRNMMDNFHYQREEKGRNERFWDGGTNIPGRQKGKNDDYVNRLKSR